MDIEKVLAGVRAYRIWEGLKNRCRNPRNRAYKYYGGRGITVCERWLDFDNFLRDMGLPPKEGSLDRINNDGNYEPGNCRWATIREQANNKRSNIRLTFQGNTLTLAEWAKRLDIPRTTLVRRYRDGRAIEEILSKDLFSSTEPMRRAMLAKRRSATHCKHGHAFTAENTLIFKSGTRHCRECARNRARDHYRKKSGTKGRSGIK